MQLFDGNYVLQADKVPYEQKARMTLQGFFAQGELIFDMQILLAEQGFNDQNYVYVYVDGQRSLMQRVSEDWFKHRIELTQGWHEIEFVYHRFTRLISSDDIVNVDNVRFFATNRDFDNDGIPDSWEYYNGMDPDNGADGLLDSDSDGLTNLYEYQHDLPIDDADNDNLTDGREVLELLTDPKDFDSDVDGMKDGWEVTHQLDPLVDDGSLDPDNDRFSNYTEYEFNTNPQDADSYPATPQGVYFSFSDGQMPASFFQGEGAKGQWKIESEGDNHFLSATADVGEIAELIVTGLSNYRYMIYRRNLKMGAGNGLYWKIHDIGETEGWQLGWTSIYGRYNDLRYEKSLATVSPDIVYIDDILLATDDSDYDGDGLPDIWELQQYFDDYDPFNGSDGQKDVDGDGLTALQEYQYGTSDRYADSDNDGISDVDEINIYGTNPNYFDSDNDGLSDFDEINAGLNPLTHNARTDTDNDGLTDAEEYLIGTDPNDTNDGPHPITFRQYTFNDGKLPTGFSFDHLTTASVIPDSNNSNNFLLTYEPRESNEYYANIGLHWNALFAEKGRFFFDAKIADDGELSFSGTGNSAIIKAKSGQWTRYEAVKTYGLGGISHVNWFLQVPSGSYSGQRYFWLDNVTFIADGVDNDNDQMNDNWEYSFRLNIHSNSDANDDLDGDGLTNLQEFQFGGNPRVADSDEDGLNDYQEAIVHLTDPSAYDSDDDGLTDGYEIENGLDPLVSNQNIDTDGDGYTDVDEYETGSDWQDSQSVPSVYRSAFIDFNDGQMPDMLRFDTLKNNRWELVESVGEGLGIAYNTTNNGDSVNMTWSGYFAAGQLSFDWKKGLGWNDKLKLTITGNEEFSFSASEQWQQQVIDLAGGYYRLTWSVSYSSFGNLGVHTGLIDNIKFTAFDLDTDGDGLTDIWENEQGLDPNDSNDASQDIDGDGLSNLSENQLGTDIYRADSDGDTINDYDEVNVYKTSPLKGDTDSDGLFDHLEVHYGLDPLVVENSSDIDNDGVINVIETYLFTDPTDKESIANEFAIATQNFASNNALIHWQSRANKGDGWQVSSDNHLSVELTDKGAYASALWLGQFTQGNVYFSYKFDAELTDSFAVSYNGQTLMSKKAGNDWLQVKVKVAGSEWPIGINWIVTKNHESSRQINAYIDNVLFIANGSDNDSDGMADQWEYENGLNFNDASDALTDLDNDGLTNLQEYQAGTNINNADTDNDGYSDSYELENGLDPHDYRDGFKDSDGDGISDGDERELGTDPLNADTDGDGVNDKDDAFPLDPLESKDEDGNGVGDNYQFDADRDGMPNDYELEFGLDAYSDDRTLDLDGDGMSNWEEFYYQFEPNNPADAAEDADSDGHSNLIEILSGTSPRDASQYPGNVSSWFHLLLQD